MLLGLTVASINPVPGHSVMLVRPMIGDFLTVMLQVFVFVVLSRRKKPRWQMRS
jgi:F0F1-type ATP synthase membrane subunit a